MLVSLRPCSRTLIAASLLLLAPTLILTGCGAPSPAPPAPAEPEVVHPGYNVIFILADTLRADHLGSYGYERATSPFIDELATTGVHFENARAQASCTFPSVNSILTSRNPFRFLDPETRPGIPEGVPSIAEILGQEGYATVAVSASPIVRKTPSKHNPKGGFGRGFDVFDEECEWYQSTCVTSRALRQVDQLEKGEAGADKPFFLYLHYMDPHDPYTPMKEYRGLFATPYKGEHGYIGEGDPNPIDTLIREERVEETLEAADFDHLIDLYDEEIYSLDVGLRQLFEGLAERDLLDKTIVVFTSDHGEAFYEHGYIKHCFSVYDNETRVPLFFRLPKLEEPVARSTWVQNIDVVPTLLDYLGFDYASHEFEGRSLRPVIESAEPPTALAYSAMGVYRSVNDDRHKLVLDLADKEAELFDLVEDPGETTDLGKTEEPRIFRRLWEELQAWTERVEGDTDAAARVERAQEIEDELRALGYLGD